MVGVEPYIWSDRFGMRGKLDAVVYVGPPGAGGVRVLAPLELKTGRSWVTHMGQVHVYHMLMSDMYRHQLMTDEMLLLYIRETGYEALGIRTDWNLIQHIVSRRNEIATYAHRRNSVDSVTAAAYPLPITDSNECARCRYVHND